MADLYPYPTDLDTPLKVLLGYLKAEPADTPALVQSCYQILGVGLGQTVGAGKPVAIQPCPDCPDADQCKAVEEAVHQMTLKRGSIGDWLKTPVGQQVLQTALTVLMSVLGSL